MPWRNAEPRPVKQCRLPWFWSYLSRRGGDEWVCPRCARVWVVQVRRVMLEEERGPGAPGAGHQAVPAREDDPVNDTDELHRERAHLVAYLAAQWPSVIDRHEGGDPDLRVVHVNTAKGQMSWHIHVDDMDLFEHVPAVTPDMRSRSFSRGDHSTDEKYERLRQLTAQEARL